MILIHKMILHTLVRPLSARLYTSPELPASRRCHSARQTSVTWTVFIFRSLDHSSYEGAQNKVQGDGVQGDRGRGCRETGGEDAGGEDARGEGAGVEGAGGEDARGRDTGERVEGERVQEERVQGRGCRGRGFISYCK